jgi:hypothetical protein
VAGAGDERAADSTAGFTSEDRGRDVLRNFNADGFESLYPGMRAGGPPRFTLAQRREIKTVAKSRPAEHGLPFSRWNLARLADFLVAEDISYERLRELLPAEGLSFEAVRPGNHQPTCGMRPERPGPASCMRSRTARRRPPRPVLMRARRRRPDRLAERTGGADWPADPGVVISVDEWAAEPPAQPRSSVGPPQGGCARARRAPRLATYHRSGGTRHLFEAQFTALREFALNGTGHATHREQNSMIRRLMAWRNRRTNDPRLRQIIGRANVA